MHVVSIQEIQEEERQLQEAILKSKQDILEIESGLVQNSQPLASSPERSKSPSSVNGDKKNVVIPKVRIFAMHIFRVKMSYIQMQNLTLTIFY